MARKKQITVPYRRKRKGLTNYKKRIGMLKSRKLRLVIRKSNKNMTLQIIEYNPKGDKIVLSADSRELIKEGYTLSRGNCIAAYLIGLKLGSKMIKEKVNDIIVDFGLRTSTKGSKMYSAIKGLIEMGIEVKCPEEMLPEESKIMGDTTSEYAQKLEKDDKSKYDKIFSNYIKNKVDPKNIRKHVEEIKKKITKV